MGSNVLGWHDNKVIIKSAIIVKIYINVSCMWFSEPRSRSLRTSNFTYSYFYRVDIFNVNQLSMRDGSCLWLEQWLRVRFVAGIGLVYKLRL